MKYLLMADPSSFGGDMRFVVVKAKGISLDENGEHEFFMVLDDEFVKKLKQKTKKLAKKTINTGLKMEPVTEIRVEREVTEEDIKAYTPVLLGMADSIKGNTEGLKNMRVSITESKLQIVVSDYKGDAYKTIIIRILPKANGGVEYIVEKFNRCIIYLENQESAIMQAAHFAHQFWGDAEASILKLSKLSESTLNKGEKNE